MAFDLGQTPGTARLARSPTSPPFPADMLDARETARRRQSAWRSAHELADDERPRRSPIFAQFPPICDVAKRKVRCRWPLAQEDRMSAQLQTVDATTAMGATVVPGAATFRTRG